MESRAREYRAKNRIKMNNEVNGFGIGMNSDSLLIIKLPDLRVLRIMSRSLFLAMVLLVLVSLSCMRRDSSNAFYESDADSDINCLKILPILFRDLFDEGLIKKASRGLILGACIGEIEDDFGFMNVNGIDLAIESDLNQNKLSQNDVFDFVLALNFREIKLIDGVLKNGGIVIVPLSNDSPNVLQEQTNYRIVYLRRFENEKILYENIPDDENTVVALRKTGASNGLMNSPTKDASCGTASEVKKSALKGLEDVYLEPPRRALTKSSFGSRKLKFLPDLLRDSLEKYPRRIFISDDTSSLDWFYKNYPMRDQQFEIYNLEIEIQDESMSGIVPQDMGISEWLTQNMKREDYVVMKAEAHVVDEMMKDKTICLVDELFLECKNQWEDEDEDGEEVNGSKRAYWQCLALYGKLRDEGIAVHQWWS
ncbi:methyltransferase [Abeliophyllum distichum]|uniref:Methyltransferase n=1 Tax=Abeliophyllum distichum TaxID=126358 RepID=A0ABD1THC8_9LAMI